MRKQLLSLGLCTILLFSQSSYIFAEDFMVAEESDIGEVSFAEEFSQEDETTTEGENPSNADISSDEMVESAVETTVEENDVEENPTAGDTVIESLQADDMIDPAEEKETDSEWFWVRYVNDLDIYPLWNKETKRYELTLPTESGKAYTLDDINKLLPQEISINAETEESVTIPVECWKSDTYLQDESGIWPQEGEYLFAGSIKEDVETSGDSNLKFYIFVILDQESLEK